MAFNQLARATEGARHWNTTSPFPNSIVQACSHTPISHFKTTHSGTLCQSGDTVVLPCRLCCVLTATCTLTVVFVASLRLITTNNVCTPYYDLVEGVGTILARARTPRSAITHDFGTLCAPVSPLTIPPCASGDLTYFRMHRAMRNTKIFSFILNVGLWYVLASCARFEVGMSGGCIAQRRPCCLNAPACRNRIKKELAAVDPPHQHV